MALDALGLSGDPFHEPFHELARKLARKPGDDLLYGLQGRAPAVTSRGVV